MGKAIPSQHPAVVLRSSYTLVRALLAIAMIAVVGLTAAVVILANDDDEVAGTTSTRPIETINYGGFNPATGRPETAPLPQRDAQAASGTTRYDGGPEEGTADVSPSQPRVTQNQAFPGLARQAAQAAQAAQADGRRYDGGPEEGSRGSGH